jgi:hypothetical protein
MAPLEAGAPQGVWWNRLVSGIVTHSSELSYHARV